MTCTSRLNSARTSRTRWALSLISLVVAIPASAETVTHFEDFMTTTEADTELTTAAWDTVTGQLHLHQQGLATIGSLGVTGQAYATAWRDDHLLLGAGSGNALLVIDASQPTNPTLVRSHPMPANARQVTVNGNWAYVSLGSGLGLQIVNVTNVTTPTTGARVDLDGFTGQAQVSANWAYAATYNGGLGVVEITDPANPVKLPSVSLAAWVRWVARQDNYLYLAADNALTVMSLTTPAAPDSVASLTVSGTAYCITVAGTWAYVGGPAGLDIVDISQPTAPQVLSNLDLGDGAIYHIAAQGDSLFAANGNGGLHIIDVANPTQPQSVADRFSPHYFYHTTLRNGLAWASNGDGGLQVLQADPQGLDPVRNRAVSANLNPGGDPVLRAKLVADYADSIAFAFSANGGTTWLPVPPDGSWLDFEPQGNDLRWRATLVQTGPAPGPVCDNLTVTFERLQSYAGITGVNDVAGDAGGWLRLTWDASRFDAPGQTHQITEYSVYRRYEAAQTTTAAYPPGDWEFLLTVPADQEGDYSATISTRADSSAQGTNWEVLFVRTRTSVAGVFFDSPPDSGFSVNNLIPAPPTGLVVDRSPPSGVQLTWDASNDPDFAHFRLYRVTSPLAMPSPETLYHVTNGTGYFDTTTDLWFYQLTMVNMAGLESPPAPYPTPVGDMPAGGGLLRQNTPNPFNPTTRIAYAVPAGGRSVRLEVCDFRGHLVAVLVDKFTVAGEHTAIWRGQDQAGRPVASGLYTCRLHCGDRITTMKMTLVR